MKQIMRLITIFFLSVMLLSCSKSPSDRLDETLDDLLSSTRYEVATIFLTDHFDEGGSWQRTVTLTRDNESYKISNRNLSYHFTTYLLNEDEQYNAYIKISNQGLYEYVKYKEEPDRFLNTIDFDVDALSSSMFDYKNDMFFLKPEYYSTIFDYTVNAFTATFDDEGLLFTIEHPEQGIIIHHFRDVGHAELTLPNLSTASKHEPREPWHEIPENVDPYLSVNHHFYPEDHVLSFEIEEDGEYLIWVESELFLNGRFYFDGELDSLLQICHGPGYGFLIKVPLYVGTTYYLNINEYSSLYQDTFDLFIHILEE